MPHVWNSTLKSSKPLRSKRVMDEFGFLYDHPTRNGYERDDYRVYKARDVNAAAAKMARFLDSKDWELADVCVDYEADHNGAHVDLYELGEDHPLYRYLP